MRKTIAILFILMLASQASAGRIALFDDSKFPTHGAPSSASYLMKLLTDDGYQVTRVSAADLMDAQVLDTSSFDLLILPQGETYPGRGKDALLRYLKQGGDFISMGGYAFDRLVYQDESGGWVDREEIYGKLSVESDVATLFDFEGNLDGWTSGGGTADMPTAILGPGHGGGKSLQVDIPNYQNYHGVTGQVHADIPKGSNYISFWARGDTRTEEMTVECDEKDGSRWIAIIDLAPEWKRYVVPAEQFRHWYDGTSRRDTLHVDNAKQISVGLAFTHTKRVSDGPHTMWIDDVQAFKGSVSNPDDQINTRFCDRDTKPLVGVFDASCPLKWVSRAESAPDQVFIPENLELKDAFTGYAAIGIFPDDSTRWVPLLNGVDRYGRPRGSLGALVVNHSGDRKGSVWAFFGVDNADLFSSRNPETGKAFLSLVDSMTRGLYLNLTGSDLACYREGELAKVTSTVSNFGSDRRTALVRLEVLEPNRRAIISSEQDVDLAPGESKQVSIEWKIPAFAPDLCRVRATLISGGKPIDIEDAAFTVWDDQIMRSGPKLSMQNGRFLLDGAPRILFGSNETAQFWSGLPQNNPLGWDREIRTMADDGLRVIRIHTAPQFFRPEENAPNEAQYRKLDAFVQLCRKHGIIPYIDTMDWAEGLKDPYIHGGDYMMDPLGLAGQRMYAASFSSRYKDAVGIMYDADNEVVDGQGSNPVRVKLWNEWLAKKYGSTQGLDKAWGKYLHGERLGEISYDPKEDAWDNIRAFDWRYFHKTQVRDWAKNFADAIHEGDPNVPCTISGLNIGGQDQYTVTEPLDVADNHFYHSLHLLPSVIKTSDLRTLGIGTALGEYGSTTHATGRDGEYCIPVDDQITRYLWIGHYLAGCGGSMALTWDFRDQLGGSFPWGVHYAGDLIDKEILTAHKQMVRFFNRVSFDTKLPPVVVCVPDNNRLGGRGDEVKAAVSRCMQVLVDNRIDFTAIREYKLDQLPTGTRALFFPTPYCISDETFGLLKRFVERGGVLYFSGDISYSPKREYLGDQRLTELAGVKSTGKPDPSDPWATRRFEAAGATVVAQDLAMNRIGNGAVFYSARPIETETYSSELMARTWEVYRKFLGAASIEPIDLSPAKAPVHCFRQPLDGGGSIYVLINRDPVNARRVTIDTMAGRIEISLGARKPGVIALNGSNEITAVEAQGAVSINGTPLIEGRGHFMAESLDGLDIRSSKQVMLLPIGPGRISIHTKARWISPIVRLGQEQDGKWRALEDFKPSVGSKLIWFSWDELRAPNVFVLADSSDASRAVRRVLDPLAAR